MNNVLVTGAAGFIGSFMAKRLLATGHCVTGVDNFFRGKEENLPNDKNFTFHNIDLADSVVDELRHIVLENKIDTVFHYAAINGTKYFYDFPYRVFSDNVKITEHTLESLKDTYVKKIIFASSSEVYGFNPKTPTSEQEDIILNIFSNRDSYAAAKVHNDFYTKLFCEENNIEYLILRIFNVYGPNMISSDYGQVVPEFARRINNEETFTIIGDGLQTRSFCYIDDHIDLTLMANDHFTNDVVNIGNDEEVTINCLAEKIHQLLSREFNPTYISPRKNDTLVRKPCINKLLSRAGNYRFINLEDGLKKLLY